VIEGAALGRWALKNWGGQLEQVVLLELPLAGGLARTRLLGAMAGIRQVLPQVPDSKVTMLDGTGRFGASLEMTRKHLRRSRAQRSLLAAINDVSALGVLRAFKEAGRVTECAVRG
jgi:ribose transport system substrate-binding protein